MNSIGSVSLGTKPSVSFQCATAAKEMSILQRNLNHVRSHSHRKPTNSRALGVIKDSCKDIKKDHDRLDEMYKIAQFVSVTSGVMFLLPSIFCPVCLIVSVLSGLSYLYEQKMRNDNDERYEQAKKNFGTWSVSPAVQNKAGLK